MSTQVRQSDIIAISGFSNSCVNPSWFNDDDQQKKHLREHARHTAEREHKYQSIN